MKICYNNSMNTITPSTSYINSSFSAYKSTKANSVSQDSFNSPEKAEESTSDNDLKDTATISSQAQEIYDKEAQQNQQIQQEETAKYNNQKTTKKHEEAKKAETE